MALVERPNFRDAVMNEVDFLCYESGCFCARIPSRCIVQYKCSKREYESLVDEFFQIIDKKPFMDLNGKGWAKLSPLTFESVSLKRHATPLGLLEHCSVNLHTKTFGFHWWNFDGENAEMLAFAKIMEVMVFVFGKTLDKMEADYKAEHAEAEAGAEAEVKPKAKPKAQHKQSVSEELAAATAEWLESEGFTTVTGKKKKGKGKGGA